MKLVLNKERLLGRKESLFFIWRGCLIALVLVYLGFSPTILKPLYYWFAFFSLPYSPKLYDKQPYERVLGYRPSDVFFDVAGGKLHGWYFKNPKSKYTILFCHGQGGNITMHGYDPVLFAREGASVLLFDYKGMGRSSGVPSFTGLKEDTLAAYKYLVDKEHVPAHTIIILGQSLGTSPAAAVASEQECKGLILIAPYLSLRAAGRRFFPHLRAYPDWSFPEPDIGCLSQASHFKAPTLIVHGDHDSTIPFSEGMTIFEAIPSKKRLLCMKGISHGSFHDFPKVEKSLFKEVQEFINDLDNPGEQWNSERRLIAQDSSI